MKRQIFVLLLFCLFVFGCGGKSRVLVAAPAGPVLGFVEDGVNKYLGIPYAASTAGDNRWRAPQPLPVWQETLDASEFGPWCPQFDFERTEEGEVRAGEGWTIFSNVPPNPSSDEDCLSLNIFASPQDNIQKPVMVYLHGNALGSSYPLFDGTQIAKSGIVFVSINFRLHSLGIFAHPALTNDAAESNQPTRFSELDRLAALRWVQQNIASFGGDPNRVTLAGASEGGAAILQLLGNRQGEGLFHQAIVQSGNGWWSPMERQQHEQFGCYLARLSGLNGCDATAQELRELAWSSIPASGPYTIDGNRVAKGATQSIEQGEFMDVPLLIGWDDFDGSSLRFEPSDVINGTHSEVLSTYDRTLDEESLGYQLYTDRHSGAPARWVAHKMEANAPVFLYLYSYVISWDQGDTRGAEHGYEIPHTLKTLDRMVDQSFPFLSRLLLSEDDRKVTEIMHGCWVSFIKDGKPSCPGAPSWPRYRRAQDQLMELNEEPRVVQGFRSKQLNAQETHMLHYLNGVKTGYADLLAKGAELE